MKNIFILTDSCMWEKNRKEKTRTPHAIEVVDAKTGQVRFIKTGSRVKFIDGEITDVFSQEQYNNEQKK